MGVRSSCRRLFGFDTSSARTGNVGNGLDAAIEIAAQVLACCWTVQISDASFLLGWKRGTAAGGRGRYARDILPQLPRCDRNML